TQVLLHGGVTAAELPGVHGHLFAFGIDAYHRACVGNLHLPADVMERHAVAMSLHQYVIVLPDLAFGVSHHLEPFFRKWRQVGLLGITEPLQPAITFLLHACLVMCVHTIGDGRVQRGKVEETHIAEPGEYPCVDVLHLVLHGSLVLRTARTCRDHHRAVMVGKLRHGAVDGRLIAVGPHHGGL